MNTAVNRAKASAKRLRARLSELGAALSHTQSLEAVASCHAATDWNRYLAALERPALPPAAPWAPPWFVMTNPGEGGWVGLRIHDLIALQRQPEKTALWIFPDHINQDHFSNALDLNIVVDCAALGHLDQAGWAALAEQARGKIVLVHAPPNFGTPDESVDIAAKALALLRGSVLWDQALNMTLVDIHRWCRGTSDAKTKLVHTLPDIGIPLRIQTQMLTDIEDISQVIPLRAIATSARSMRELVLWVEQEDRRLNFGVEIASMGRSAAFHPDRLETLDGCLAYASLTISAFPYPRLSVETEYDDPRMNLVQALRRDERKRWEQQRADRDSKGIAV